jgi:2-oxoglutarate dehydrogenase E1 component
MTQRVVERLQDAREAARVEKPRGKVPTFSGVWRGLRRAPNDYREWAGETAIDPSVLRRCVEPLKNLPKDFKPHPKLKKLIEQRVSAASGDAPIDFATAEHFAFGSLLLEGNSVRMTGQDVERGTFSHRHGVLHDYETGKKYRPLQHVGSGTGDSPKHVDQGHFELINTMLSEEAVVGFEWGFSSADPRNLVVWEAQFGDFVNGAQAVIDQILAAAEAKWRYMNGIVLNLPHGYEGMGPEHSNAYLERFLTLCAENNMQVAVPSTAAQYFHLLRRQIRRDFRKPLILMMPKSLLRKPEATSTADDLTRQGLSLVIDDPAELNVDNVKRVLLCSGKVYHTLDQARRKEENQSVAVVRVEQLYPFPEHEIRAAVGQYAKASEIVWTQEEPANRGAWQFVQPRLRELFPDRLVQYCGRDASASPASGSAKMHVLEEQEFVAAALDVDHTIAAAT